MSGLNYYAIVQPNTETGDVDVVGVMGTATKQFGKHLNDKVEVKTVDDLEKVKDNHKYEDGKFIDKKTNKETIITK